MSHNKSASADLVLTGTGLDMIVKTILSDQRLTRQTSSDDLQAGAHAANEMNHLIVEAVKETGVAQDGVITPDDVALLNAYLRADPKALEQWIEHHGDDEHAEETGFHLVQNDGAKSELEGENIVDKIADGLYHLAFELTDGVLENEDGLAMNDLGQLATWLNKIYLENSVVFGSDAQGAMADRIKTGEEADIIYARGGDDMITSKEGDDYVSGGEGRDTVWAGDGDDLVEGDGGDDKLYGQHGDDTLRGADGDDRMYGAFGDDRLCGGDGVDRMMGGDGNDLLMGGAGADRLIGGRGADTFQLISAENSGVGRGNHDVIFDFKAKQGDVIDVSYIDADIFTEGDQEFSFIGKSAFSGEAGELRFAGWKLSGDIDGDGAADFEIRVLRTANISEESLLL